MDQQTLQIIAIVAVVVVIILVVLIVLGVRRRRERESLRARFGPEYDRTVAERGSKRAAVRDLKEREALHEQLRLRDLNDADRDLLRRHMATLQYRFVEDPGDVLLQTGRIATEVLRARGYPVNEDRDRALRLFSVDHPDEAGYVRDVIQGTHGRDVGHMRDTFLGVRHVLQEIAGVSYVLGDAADRPEELGPTTGQPPAATVPVEDASTSTPSHGDSDAPSGRGTTGAVASDAAGADSTPDSHPEDPRPATSDRPTR